MPRKPTAEDATIIMQLYELRREPLLREEPVHRRARKRLGGEQDLPVVVTRGQAVPERAGALADVLLDDDVRRGAELTCELDRVAAAERQMPSWVHTRPGRSDVRELGDRGGHGRHDMRTARRLRPA